MTTMKKVRPAAPVAPWLGGKKALSARIIERIEAIDHVTYAEPFVGMGGVFLRRSWKPQCEVANDFNGEITNLFRILQQHLPQLMEVMRYQIASRRDFERLRQTEPSTLTDLQRAARFLYLQRQAFGGKPGGVFGVAADRPARFSLSRLEPILEAAHERLESVIFENLDWSDLIARYDGAQTLFYLDPPYWGGWDMVSAISVVLMFSSGAVAMYAVLFTRAENRRIAALQADLAEIQKRILMEKRRSLLILAELRALRGS